MNNIKKAAKIIKDGGLVAFPTETVYGLGADATNHSACLDIFRIKGRPSNNPLIIHVDSISNAEKLVEFNDDAYKLSKFWPGPLSIVLPKKNYAQIAASVSANLYTLAVRIPSNPIALDLIKQSNCPIAAPSANLSGKLSPTSFIHVKENFTNNQILILNGNSSICGLESTIIDLSTNIPTILRYGFITPENIESVLKKKVCIASKSSKIKAPGMLYRHYSPNTKLRINATNLFADEIGLNFANSKLDNKISLNFNLSKTGNLAEAAGNLFEYLHQLDKIALSRNLKTIAVATIPNKSIGLAINDRLNRAAQTSTN